MISGYKLHEVFIIEKYENMSEYDIFSFVSYRNHFYSKSDIDKNIFKILGIIEWKEFITRHSK